MDLYGDIGGMGDGLLVLVLVLVLILVLVLGLDGDEGLGEDVLASVGSDSGSSVRCVGEK